MTKLLEQFVEYDINPFVVFDSNGKLIHYNQEAEYILSFVSPHKIYELALAYAPKSFGMRKNVVNLRYDRYVFCAILVGYINEDKIGIKLYKEMINSSINNRKDKVSKVNLFSLLQLSEHTVFTNKKILVTESFDPTVPDMELYVDSFLKLLNSIFNLAKENREIEIIVRVKIGQTLLVDGKSYQICNVIIKTTPFKIKNKNFLYNLAQSANVMLIIKDNNITIEFPIID